MRREGRAEGEDDMNACKFWLLAAALASLACTGSSRPAPPAPNDRTALEAAIREVRLASASRAAAIEKGDIEGALSTYQEDAVWLPSESEEFVGKELARAKLKSFFTDMTVQEEYQPEEHALLGPQALLERGNYAVELTPRDGGAPVPDAGTYLNVWRKGSDNQWRIAYQMWTSHGPIGRAVAGGKGTSR